MIRLRVSIVLLMSFCGVFCRADDRPNILFIMSDDHTTQAIGAYATLLKELDPTPTIDSIAAEGMCFDNAFCTNAICTPSRACIITGQYNHNNGVFDLGGSIEPSKQVLPRLMREAGYQTAIIGKWHLKVEPNYDYYKVLPGQGKYFDTEFRIQGDQPWPQNTVAYPGSHSTDVITDAALDWFKNKRDPDKPFFVSHHYKAPHDYFESNPRYDDYLADVQIPEPDSLWNKPNAWGSIATRGHGDELLPHIGTSIGRRNPRRSYAADLPKQFPNEFKWDYDDAKVALEVLFDHGRVAAVRRPNDFARLYDIAERVIPAAALAVPSVPEHEARKELLVLAARSHGVGTVGDLADYHRHKHCKPLVAELVEEGRLLEVEVEGWKQPGYLHPDATIPRRIEARALLSPFDPVVWNRDRALRIFGFHYRIEIYVPQPKRQYGYYVLPFLLGDELVGRVDLKADRAARTLLVQSAWGEPGIPEADVAGELADELRLLAGWLELERVEVVGRGDLSPALSGAL